VTAPEQAEVLRLALDERDRTVQALQEAVYNLEQTSIRRDEQYAAHSASTSTLGHQVKALKEDAAERATKGAVRELRTEIKIDIALVRKDIEVLRTELKNDIALVCKDMAVLRAETKAGFSEINAKVDELRKDFEAQENRLIVKLGGMMAVVIGAVVALLRVFPAG